MKDKRKNILKIIGLFLLTFLDVSLLCICENTWIAWLIISVSVIGYCGIKLKKVVKKTGWIVLALLVVNIVAFHLTNQISLMGGIMSKLLVPMMTPEFAGEMLQNREDSLQANQEHEQETWSKDGYCLEKMKADKVKFEKIYPENSESKKVIMYIHGGAFVVGVKNSNRDLAVKFSKVSDGAMVVLPDYTTSEKAPYPAALNDCIDTYQWILDQGYKASDIIVAGDSAGGNLSLALGLYLRDHNLPLPGGIITISAFANMKFDSPSYKTNADKCVLGKWFGQGHDPKRPFFYIDGKDIDVEDPYVSPVFGDYKGFPKLLMQVGSREIVLDDTKTIAAKVKEAGGEATATIYQGMWHVFQIIGIEFPEAALAWDEIEDFVCDTFELEK